MLFVSPNGVAVEAADEAAESLKAAGFKPQQAKAAEKKQPRRRTASKTTEKGQ
ncbi:MAG: hypothetical protein IJ087_10105 [Eggerthellaceae bacterium]|nr:hypothetical protein [Eggerthellaceae bacterium]